LIEHARRQIVRVLVPSEARTVPHACMHAEATVAAALPPLAIAIWSGPASLCASTGQARTVTSDQEAPEYVDVARYS
jgi:hypothetical protein